jgi:hypothetical protein
VGGYRYQVTGIRLQVFLKPVARCPSSDEAVLGGETGGLGAGG